MIEIEIEMDSDVLAAEAVSSAVCDIHIKPLLCLHLLQ